MLEVIEQSIIEIENKGTRLLGSIEYPADLRQLKICDLPQVAEELRQETINKVAKTGGHLGAGLGVVELTIALHYVFNTPHDKLIWDIGHQGYPHKIITGRKHQMHTIRQGGGLSGFLKRDESEYDVFGAGHSSTSLSAAHGMAVARDLSSEDYHIVSVIGDGAISAGMAYEALNNIGAGHHKMLVILNDNEMSIAKPTGAMSKYLIRMMSSKPYLNIRGVAKKIVKKFPHSVEEMAKNTEKYAKSMFMGSNIFEELGFYYLGPVYGHDVRSLVKVLQNFRDDKTISGPVLLHIITEKGKGFSSTNQCGEKFHAVAKFDPETGEQIQSSSTTYTKVFADQLIKHAHNDDKIVAITAAMPSGTGLSKYSHIFPERFFDVGIAEQHAVTFAAGLAAQGYKPVVAIYSTFLQRAYDQIIHDVALQNLPVRFAIDRAGFVGADGPTHAGCYDIAYLGCIPNMVIMAPSDEQELSAMIATSLTINDRPSAFRYPRGEVFGLEIPDNPEILEIGKGRIIQQGEDIAIISLGSRLDAVKKAAEKFYQETNKKITIIDARFAKPLDEELMLDVAKNHQYIISIEDGARGGFAAYLSELFLKHNVLQNKNFVPMFIPDHFIEHDTQELMYDKCGLGVEGILKTLYTSNRAF